jgi:hypothetical protein
VNRWYDYPKYKADDHCRFCGHRAHFHMVVKNFGMDNMQTKWDKCDKPATDCSCPGFAPEDNLAFLEEQSSEA